MRGRWGVSKDLLFCRQIIRVFSLLVSPQAPKANTRPNAGRRVWSQQGLARPEVDKGPFVSTLGLGRPPSPLCAPVLAGVGGAAWLPGASASSPWRRRARLCSQILIHRGAGLRAPGRVCRGRPVDISVISPILLLDPAGPAGRRAAARCLAGRTLLSCRVFSGEPDT